MSRRAGSFLGLSLGDSSIACSEVVVGRDRRLVRRTAMFVPHDSLFGKPETTGQALASFLRQHKFRASRAVVGVPARWLLASEREVPPADPEQMAAVLRLHAERISVSENGDLVFDYAGRADATRGGKVLLVGILQQQLNRVESLLDSAGIRILAITPTSVALAAAMDQPPTQPLLVLGRQGAELLWHSEGCPRLLRHVPMTSLNGHGVPALAPLGAELRRTVALAPANGAGSPRELLLWDGLGLSDEQRSELAGRTQAVLNAGKGVRSIGLSVEGTPSQDEMRLLEEYGPAMALAAAGARHRELPLDFKRSRLAPPRQRRFGRRSVWATVVAATLTLVVAALGWDVHEKQSILAGIQDSLESDKDRVKQAEQDLERFSTAQRYFEKRLPVLDCLREITIAFRDDEPTWATSIRLGENRKGQILGKATDQRAPLALGERLQQNRTAFVNAQTTQVIEQQAAGGRSKEQAFTITFEYKGSE